MDKNTITGFVLIALVIIGFSWYSRPSEAELQEMARQDSIQQVQKQAEQAQALQQEEAAQEAVAQMKADSAALFFSHLTGTSENVTLKNEYLEVVLDTKGGAPKEATILSGSGIKTGNPVRIMDDSNQLYMMVSGKHDNIDTRNYYFTPTAQTDSTVTMRLTNADGATFDIAYKLRPESYMLDISVQARQMGKYFEPNTKTVYLQWEKDAKMLEKGFDFEQQFSSLTYKEKNEDTDNLSESGEDNETMEMPLEWVAFKNQFFSCVLIAPDQFDNATLKSSPCQKGSGDLKKYSAHMNCGFDPRGAQPTELSLYLGPNDFHILKEHDDLIDSGKDLELENLVYLGWPLFRIINRWLILPLFEFLSGFGMNMGIVLLLLTLIVKAFVYPTTKKSYLSSARMRVLKPKVDALNAKYPKPEDAMKKQTEMMQLYREYGVSPMGGCLPMLIQMPIWIALFNFVPNAIALRGEKFLWADDLSAYDELLSWDADLWLIGDHLSIFCILFCATNIINTWISMRQQKDQMSSEQAQQMKMMQYMMYIMPLMFFFMFNNYSSGLCYYYFLSGLTSILIMWFLRKTTDDKKLLAKLEEYRAKHKNDPKKAGGMVARLEALQKQMEEQQKNRK